MKQSRKMLVCAAVLTALALGGCANMGPNQTVGTGVGAVGGYAVGRALGGGPVGSAVGAVVGATVGGNVGSSMDQQQAQQAYPQPPVVYRERVIVRECTWVREYDRYYGVMRERRICR